MTAPVLEAGPERLLCVGLILRLQAAALLSWQPDGSYPATFGGVAAYFTGVPDSPDRLASFTPYPVTDDPDQHESQCGVQIRTRWAGSNPAAVNDYSSLLFRHLQGLGPVELPNGVRVSQVLRQSSTSMGQDASGRRWSWSDNYYVVYDRGTA